MHGLHIVALGTSIRQPLDEDLTTTHRELFRQAVRSPAMSTSVVDVVRPVGRTVVRAAAMATADLRPAPDLVIIGVKRGGTTSLFRDLERHPSMCPLVPSARRLPLRENQKGVHYFDSDMARSDRWYRSHFPTSTTRWWRTRRVGHAFAAEASPYYLFHPLAAQRAADALPLTHFVVVLRDPVERTVSHWAEQTRNGVETLTLREALDAEDRRVGDAGERLANGTLGESHAHEQQSYAAQSHYAASLDRWIEAVGRERLTIAYSEDYFADPSRVIGTVLAEAGLPPLPHEQQSERRNAAPRPATLDADIDDELTDRFRPDVAELTGRLGLAPPWPRFIAPMTGE
jgi:hypothetical protein